MQSSSHAWMKMTGTVRERKKLFSNYLKIITSTPSSKLCSTMPFLEHLHLGQIAELTVWAVDGAVNHLFSVHPAFIIQNWVDQEEHFSFSCIGNLCIWKNKHLGKTLKLWQLLGVISKQAPWQKAEYAIVYWDCLFFVLMKPAVKNL